MSRLSKFFSRVAFSSRRRILTSIRSVNLTETLQALSMITKAGVPSNKIVVGFASYARSFQMVDPSCTGPNCPFTGSESGATPGSCTQARFETTREEEPLTNWYADRRQRRAQCYHQQLQYSLNANV